MNLTLKEMIREAEIADNKLAIAIYEALIEEGKALIVELHEAISEAVDSIEYDMNEVRVAAGEHFQSLAMTDRITSLLDDEGVLTDDNRESVISAVKEYFNGERKDFDYATSYYLKEVVLPEKEVAEMHNEIASSSFGDVLEEEPNLIFDKRKKT